MRAGCAQASVPLSTLGPPPVPLQNGSAAHSHCPGKTVSATLLPTAPSTARKASQSTFLFPELSQRGEVRAAAKTGEG